MANLDDVANIMTTLNEKACNKLNIGNDEQSKTN